MLATTSTKERIHQAAVDLFARNGYHATGMQELSETVGLARGALYHHIRHKEELLEGIICGVLEPLVAGGRMILDRPLDVEEKMRLLARALLRDLADHKAEWTITVRDSSALSSTAAANVSRLRDRYEDLWRDAFAEGVAAGRLRPVDDVVRKGILGMFNHSFAWIASVGHPSPEAIADEYLELVLDGIVLHRGSTPPLTDAGTARRRRRGSPP